MRCAVPLCIILTLFFSGHAAAAEERLQEWLDSVAEFALFPIRVSPVQSGRGNDPKMRESLTQPRDVISEAVGTTGPENSRVSVQQYSSEEKSAYYWLHETLMTKLRSQPIYRELESEMGKSERNAELYVYNFDVTIDGAVQNLHRYGRPLQRNRAEELIESLIKTAEPFAPPPNDLTMIRGITLDFRYDGKLITTIRLLQRGEKKPRKWD